MGINGLEMFINDGHQSIPQEISILNEIEKWRCEHGIVPSIMVDLKEFLRVIAKIDEGGLILGGRFEQINEIFEYFFGAIEPHANLVFFVRLNEGTMSNINRFVNNDYAFDCIKYHKSLKDHLDTPRQRGWTTISTLRPNERLWNNFLKIAQNYGEVIANYGSTKGAILMYARQNHDNVMALISRDTEFLVYDGDFQFWSISNIDYQNIKIVRFCRQKLYETLHLNKKQMQLLCALSNLHPAHKRTICGGDGLLMACVWYVKKQHYGQNGYEASKLTGQFTDDQLEEVQNELERLKFLDNYAGSWDDDVYNDLLTELISYDPNFKIVLEFCKNNIYFAYKLMNEGVTFQKDLLFVDLRRPDSGDFLDMMADVTMKLCGVIFKDVDPAKRPKTRTVYQKIDGKTELMEKDIIYPPNSLSLPSLKDLIIEVNDEQFTDSRWSLFQWLVNPDAETISKFKDSSESKYIRLVRFTLEVLLKNDFITTHEVNIIQRTESDGQSKGNVYKPKRFCPPPPLPNDNFPRYVELDWVITAHKYTIAFELICHCLELCGLGKETTLILFNALKFHESMHMARKDSGHGDNMERKIRNLHLN